MWDSIKRHWNQFLNSFHGSETIIWARIQLLIGAAYIALQAVDITQFISDKHALQYYIFGNALLTEYLRRRRSDFDRPHE